MAIDLNKLMPASTAEGHYGAYEPENAWDGAGATVRVYVLIFGHNIMQIGWTEGQPTKLQVRTRRRDYAEWGDWTPVDLPAPPEPPEEVIPGPALAALDPNEAMMGSADLTLRVLGENYDEGSVIVFNGGDEVTAFISATELHTGVKPSLVGAAIAVPVLVRNADGQQSAVLDFTFTPQPEPEE
jgi:hypothetical protein